MLCFSFIFDLLQKGIKLVFHIRLCFPTWVIQSLIDLNAFPLLWSKFCSSVFSKILSTHYRKATWLKAPIWCNMRCALSNAPYANNTEHMLFLAAWQARSYYSWMFCAQLCAAALGVSCYQCGARRYSSCFNSAPYVPLDPSQLTWCESNSSFFIFCQLGHTFCFVCLSYCFSFQK